MVTADTLGYALSRESVRYLTLSGRPAQDSPMFVDPLQILHNHNYLHAILHIRFVVGTFSFVLFSTKF